MRIIMKRISVIRHEFVEFIPEPLEDGVIYISMEYATASHICCCGCGKKVVTPISPTDWKVTFDGKSVSLYPSVGSWNLACQSHYFITNNKIKWAEQWSDERIRAGKAYDAYAKQKYYENEKLAAATKVVEQKTSKSTRCDEPKGLLARIKGWWSS
jgi:hypothetical protein